GAADARADRHPGGAGAGGTGSGFQQGGAAGQADAGDGTGQSETEATAPVAGPTHEAPERSQPASPVTSDTQTSPAPTESPAAADPEGRPALEERSIQAIEITPPPPPPANSQPATAGKSGGGGGPQGVRGMFQARKDRGDFVYVVDRSGSMQGDAFAKARTELIRTIGRLKPESSFYVIFYSDEPLAMPRPGRVPAIMAQKADAASWISTMTAGGGTRPLPAMKRAMQLRPDTIFLLSDGEFSDDVADEIRRMNRHKAEIFTIGFDTKANIDVLKQIARENRGEYRYVDPSY
ncbi:MAG: VWA domain-containing protein, partial [Phycisphaeraceae bacterium]